MAPSTISQSSAAVSQRSRIAGRTTGIVIVAMVFAALAVGIPPGRAQTAPPCSLDVTRSVAPRVVAAGESVTVTVRWRYACKPDERRVRDVVIALDISAGLNDASGRLLPAVQDGLARIVNRLPVDEARLGIIFYDTRIRANLQPATGLEAYTQRRDAIRGVRNTGSGFADARVALDAAAAALGDEAQEPVIVLVDVGGSLPPSRSISDVLTTCRSLQDAGASVAVLSLPGSNARFASCASIGGEMTSITADGSDAPLLLGGLAGRWIGDPDPLLTEWHEPLDAAGWSYELASGRPRDPDALRGAERMWQEYAISAAGDHTLTWRAKAQPVRTAVTTSVTTAGGPFVALIDRAGHAFTWPAPRVPLCIHPAESVDGCAGFVARLTATVPAPSPDPPSTPTVPSITATPTTAAPGATETPAAATTTTPSPTPDSGATLTATRTPAVSATAIATPSTATPVPTEPAASPTTERPEATPTPGAAPRAPIFLPMLIRGAGARAGA